jgi:hypothetical protein
MGMLKSVLQRLAQGNVMMIRDKLTEMKVAGRKAIVTKVSVFIAALSKPVVDAILRLSSAFVWAIRLYS